MRILVNGDGEERGCHHDGKPQGCPSVLRADSAFSRAARVTAAHLAFTQGDSGQHRGGPPTNLNGA